MPAINPAMFTWTPSGVEYLYDIRHGGVPVTQVLFVGGLESHAEHEAELRAELAEGLQYLLASMSNHERLAFWARVIGKHQ